MIEYVHWPGFIIYSNWLGRARLVITYNSCFHLRVKVIPVAVRVSANASVHCFQQI